MSKIRVRLEMTWSVNVQEKGPFSDIEDFKSFAERVLVQSFAHYDAALRLDEIKELNPSFTDIHMTWDVNLDGVAGGYHNPEDHESYAKSYLKDQIKFFSYGLKVHRILRQAELSEAIDHTEIMRMAHEADMVPTAEDYPTFIPEKHPYAPEFNECWLQDGCWFWAEAEKRMGSTPAGPVPEKIFVLWDPDYREREYAKFLRKMELEELHAAG